MSQLWCHEPGCNWAGTTVGGDMHVRMYPDHVLRAEPRKMAPSPVAAYACKVDGCKGVAESNRGPYSYLCPEHKTSAPSGGRGTKRPAKEAQDKPTGSIDRLAADVRRAREAYDEALHAFTDAVDRLKDELAA